VAEIYVLLGDADWGKSSTIKEIYRMLSIANNNIAKNYPNDNYPIAKDGYDIKAEVVAKKKATQESVLVGIESHGDPVPKNNKYQRLKNSLDDFAKSGCEKIFCAERIKIPPGILVVSQIVAQWAVANNSKKGSKPYTVVPILQTARNNGQYYNAAKEIIQMAGLE
jgi:hypothetical protein